ncbi:TRAP transporter large permease subunit [Streptomyces albidoflavus]|uniref:Transporter n=1 Tax=Streptomyces albidoflavus TaxID=1886 RepID=A0AB37XK05_9ACTN|nr:MULTISPECIES: TRAP transporter large permease subunit [Streptomyces]MYQ74348.1 TRAP transporter large permease subunit [Streptomyces sp. SID4934]MYX83340.1 TRAP transporter large permease subunit [Streptomyces sp. SID4915]NUW06117.1 TRAP transporter large permease subunit [Streptomyces sp. CAI-21]NVI30372.1 TRAP transporter large permease subunit [Streptomyces sp. CAI-17]QLA55147.1 TRAP transporter large permease subunit [Streptomyces violascens]SCE20795.1 Tripartite ATP-independent transp
MGVVILLVMAAGVAAMLTRKLPTAFALVLLGVVIAFVAGAPLTGENSVLDTVLQEGAPALAATMIAILLGSWLGRLLDETGIAGTLVRKIVEFGGDRPVVVALGVLAVSTLVGTVTGSAPAAMLAGIIGIPAMIAVGIPKVTAAGTILMGIAAGMPFELPIWQFFSTALELPVPTVRGFMLKLFPFALAAAVLFVLVETRRRGVEHAWSLKSASAKPASRREQLGDAPWYALLTPVVPLVLALGLEVAILPSMLAGVLFALVTTTRPRDMNKRLLRTLYGSFEVAAAPIVLFVAIGILLAAVKLPGAVESLEPLVKAVSPQNPVLFVLVFTLLVPLCLYRGPLNVYGLGAGIAGVLIAAGIYPAVAVLGLATSYNQVFGVADPTSTQTVWSAQYAGTTPQQVMLRTLPYVWAVALGGLCVTAATYL